jgi:extracellular factor (EF) 3-hydroxypalmitic acid methyl ester biosynthesis protein
MSAVAPPDFSPRRRASDAFSKAAGRNLCPEYCEAVDAAVSLLGDYRRQLAGAERALPQDSEEFGLLAAELWQCWRAVWDDASACMSELSQSAEHLAVAKQYTEAHLTGGLLSAPIWRQAYTKPRGYSGDYVVMNYIYQGAALGDTTFARLAHALALRIGEFVVRRKDMIGEAIAEVARKRAGGTATVVSLGCGPAREVADFAAQDAGAQGPVTFILVDHDEDALRFAGRSIGASRLAHGARRPLRTDLRRLSALRLLRDVLPADAFGSADLIYSAGLFDYFSDRTCRLLTRRLYEALRPGGMLVLGNMKADTDLLWPLYLIADWSLHYRTAENVMSWASGLSGAAMSLRTETTGYDYLLTIRKPG